MDRRRRGEVAVRVRFDAEKPMVDQPEILGIFLGSQKIAAPILKIEKESIHIVFYQIVLTSSCAFIYFFSFIQIWRRMCTYVRRAYATCMGFVAGSHVRIICVLRHAHTASIHIGLMQ